MPGGGSKWHSLLAAVGLVVVLPVLQTAAPVSALHQFGLFPVRKQMKFKVVHVCEKEQSQHEQSLETEKGKY